MRIKLSEDQLRTLLKEVLRKESKRLHLLTEVSPSRRKKKDDERGEFEGEFGSTDVEDRAEEETGISAATSRKGKGAEAASGMEGGVHAIYDLEKEIEKVQRFLAAADAPEADRSTGEPTEKSGDVVAKEVATALNSGDLEAVKDLLFRATAQKSAHIISGDDTKANLWRAIWMLACRQASNISGKKLRACGRADGGGGGTDGPGTGTPEPEPTTPGEKESDFQKLNIGQVMAALNQIGVRAGNIERAAAKALKNRNIPKKDRETIKLVAKELIQALESGLGIKRKHSLETGGPGSVTYHKESLERTPNLKLNPITVLIVERMYARWKQINESTYSFTNETDDDHSVIEKLAGNLYPYLKKQLKFDRDASIRLISDPENGKNPLGKTAYYDPSSYAVTIYADNRHPKDILRSFSHEMVHHSQNCQGNFDNTVVGEQGYAQNDSHLREMERQAYEVGNLAFRDWEDGMKSAMMERIQAKLAENSQIVDQPKLKLALKEAINKDSLTKALFTG
jgi:hypothetical protein